MEHYTDLTSSLYHLVWPILDKLLVWARLNPRRAAVLAAALLLFFVMGRIWRNVNRPVLVKLADGYPAGLELVVEGEKRIVSARIEAIEPLAVTEAVFKQQSRQLKERLEQGRKDLEWIQSKRDSSPFRDESDLVAADEHILKWGIVQVLQQYEIDLTLLHQLQALQEKINWSK